ncbi:MAG: BamA/TamA family outer membrane protein, partial [Saprospiraceae bacterium]
EPVAKDIYDQETTRITKYLRNNGYAYFYPNSISPLQGDSTGNKVDVTLEVLRPASDSIHKQYYIGKVSVFPDYNAATPEANLRDSLIRGVHFYSNQIPYRVRASVLRNQVYLKEGDLYQQDNFDKTNREFGTLGVFKFVTIKQQIDTLDDNKINFFIYLSRSKQLEFGVDFDVNFTQQRNGIQRSLNLLGFSISPSIRNRNVFGGAELLISRAEAGLETAVDTNFINTIDISLSNELFFPKFIDYINLWRTMNKIGGKRKMVSDRFYQTIREKATTRVAIEYNFLKRIFFFEYNLFNASFGYDLQADSKNRFLINHVGVDLLLPQTDTAFQRILDANPFLQRSFGKQLFTGLFFKDFNYIYTGRPDRNGNTWNISAYSEISGTEVWLANKLYNGFSASIEPDTFQFTRIVDGLRDTTEFAQYAKLQIDARYNKQFNPLSSLAVRFYAGVGFPFGFSEEVPYVKQYFVGGPNSMRGWNVRGLGPGSYIDPEETDRRFFYQTGDVRLELNLEYRFNLFKLWSAVTKGAVFIDAGNIWTLNDDGRAGGQFLWSPRSEDGQVINEAFYQQIANNSGFGFRFDLSYFIFRLDLGYPLRYPSLDPLNGNGGERWQQVLSLNRVNYVIGLGYPF